MKQQTFREELIRELHKLRKNGWEETPYNIPFNEAKADNWKLYHHVRKVKKHRNEVIWERTKLTLKVIAIILLIIIAAGGRNH